VSFGSDDVAENVVHHMADVHVSVAEASVRFHRLTGRHNYVTPKSFLELVAFYKGALGSKRDRLRAALERLRAGLQTLRSTAANVSVLQAELKVKLANVEERKAATDVLLGQMGQQRGEAHTQQAIASKERIRAEKFAKEAEEIEADAATELAAAQPALDHAEEAVNCLTKASLTELKSLTKPPAGVDKVTTCVLMMVKNEKKNFSWDNAKRMMANIDKFKQELEEFDPKVIPDELIERIAPILNDPEFTFERLCKKSSAAANMANWVINIIEYNKIYVKVKPLMTRLEEARTAKEDAMADLKRVEAQLRAVEDRLNSLQERFMVATNEKTRVEAEASECTNRLQLAGRLVNGLSSENERWEKEAEQLQKGTETLVGDTLLASAFVSYIGAFDADARVALWKDVWTNDIMSREIPLCDGSPLKTLADDAAVAKWGMEGLPADLFSIENGALITSCTRWPLVIDPQLQGLAWLKLHFSGDAEAADSNAAERAAAAVSAAINTGDAEDADEAEQEQQQQAEVPAKPQLGRRQTSVRGSTASSGAAAAAAAASASASPKSASPKAGGAARSKKVTTAADPNKKELVILQPGAKNWLQTMVAAVKSGATVILENVGETFDPVLEPLLARSFTFKGRQPYLTLGGREVEYDPEFRLVIQTRAANPHFRPEVLAQCTLINFNVTEQGLEDQLLAHVVSFEKAELERHKQELQRAFNVYKIQLLQLEDALLSKLSAAPPDILSDIPLIESLEATKATANEVARSVERGRETEKGINAARELYRPVAVEAAMLYFLVLQLGGVHHMYQYSLESFLRYFGKAIAKTGETKAPGQEGLRVQALTQAVRLTIFTAVNRGLLVEHRTAFLVQMTLNLLRRGVIKLKQQEDRFDAETLGFLLKAPRVADNRRNDIEWLPDAQWHTVLALAELPGFEKLPADMMESAPRFREWYGATAPEQERLPLDWRELDKTPFLKLLVVRALRPDRTLAALQSLVRSTLPNGHLYADCDAQRNSYQVLVDSFADAGPETPVYLIISSGANVVDDVERLARQDKRVEGQTFFNVSMGQGQDTVAMAVLDKARAKGHWVLLNNLHLMPSWLPQLCKKLDEETAKTHDDFRLFLSSAPSRDIPVSLLNRCIKLSSEPPTGLRANLARAWASFDAAEVDGSDAKSRSILFGLCYFHSAMLERRTYGTKGFNMPYPFSGQDLAHCSLVLRNCMDKHAGAKLPWADLRYLFGEIMYGGHIANDWDRRVCNTYLEYYLNDALLSELDMFPFAELAKQQQQQGQGQQHGEQDGAMDNDLQQDGKEEEDSSTDSKKRKAARSFHVQGYATHERYVAHLNESFPAAETPLAFGMHPNAELGFRTQRTSSLFKLLVDMQTAKAASDEDGAQPSALHLAEATMQDILEVYRDVRLDTSGAEHLTDPFQTHFLQECKRFNALAAEMVRSLTELELGCRGALTMTERMDKLMDALVRDAVPEAWQRISYPSQRPLGSWLANLQQRAQQLSEWLELPERTPACTWISGFFNPQSFLTAVLQTRARASGVELDKLVITTEVLKKRANDIDDASRDGAYVKGLWLEGARWDLQQACMAEQVPRETVSAMPVINIKAVPAQELEQQRQQGPTMYSAPVYRTQRRGDTFVFAASLRTKLPAKKWVLAGACLLLDPEEQH
jgi:dynein heavy chain